MEESWTGNLTSTCLSVPRLYWQPGSRFFLKLNDVFNALLSFSKQGTMFVFGSLGTADKGDFLSLFRNT